MKRVLSLTVVCLLLPTSIFFVASWGEKESDTEL